jgi:hypothetical protein
MITVRTGLHRLCRHRRIDSIESAYRLSDRSLRANIALSVRPCPQAPALNPEAIELTVTMPLLPSYLEKELAATLRRPGGFLTTSAAFTRLAQTASRRLVVMTPFIDAGGFRWLRRLFETTSADCQKIVVLRNTDRYMVELFLTMKSIRPCGARATVRTPEPREDFTRDAALTGKSGRLAPPINAEFGIARPWR